MAQDIRDTSSIGQHVALESDGEIHQFIAFLGAASRHIALLTAWVAMCGSLFFSEVLGWVPCVLCWYQRILMYPLAFIIAIGILRRDSGLHLYLVPFSLFGASVSLYHYLLVKTDWLPPPPCATGVSCTVDYLNWFGFINIPFLALMAFLIISFMAIASTLQPFDTMDTTGSEATHNHVRGVFHVGNVAVFAIIGIVVGSFMIAAQVIGR